MKRFFMLILAFGMMAGLLGCSGKQEESKPEMKPAETTAAKTYAVTIKDNSWLVETLEDQYAAGEIVVVKVKPMPNAKITLLVNGKEVTQSETTETCIQFEFTMPAEPVTLEVKSTDLGNWGALN